MCFPSVVFLLFEINSMNKFYRSYFGSRILRAWGYGAWYLLSSSFWIFYLSHLIQWIFTKIRPARSRLYQRIFEFFLRVRWERAFNSQFRKEKRQNSKKKREKNLNEDHDFSDFHTLRRTFLAKFLGIFDFLALLSARSRRVLANREERIKKENFSAFFWPVEICEILVRLLIVKVNKLVYIITRRNRLGSGWDFNNF